MCDQRPAIADIYLDGRGGGEYDLEEADSDT